MFNGLRINKINNLTQQELRARTERLGSGSFCFRRRLLGLLLFFILSLNMAWGEVDWTNEQIANAIYKAENSIKYPYGIKSIDTKGDKEYARKICLNTIRNHRIRHTNHKCNLDFISCLGARYCPVKAHKLNQFWIRNVKFYLERS